MKRLALLSVASLFLLTGCPSTGIVCMPGTTQCGQGCADLHFDNRNCGACGNACGANQACIGAMCTCSEGTIACGALCVTTATDPQNCGGCGNACAANEVCEFDPASNGGKCHPLCNFGPSCGGDGGCTNANDTNCGGACVDTTQDPAHCGDCATQCEQGQICRSGSCTFELVAACFTSGQVVGMSAAGTRAASATQLGAAPASLAALGDVLLSADGINDRLYQANVHSLSAYGRADVTGHAPNQVLADPPLAYVVNSATGTLQVFRADGGLQANDAGVAFNTIGEVAFGGNSFPEAVAKAGGALWVPLYGGVGTANADAGQKVIKVDATNPAMPVVSGVVNLSGLDLHPFDGGAPVARPFAIAAHRGQLYVALNNLNPDTYVPEGPGMLAKIDPLDGGLSSIVLDANKCLNPVWLTSDGTHLFVSCAGAAVYDMSFNLLSSTAAGVVMLDSSDALVSSWAAQCPSGDGGCKPILPSRMAVKDGRVFVGDSNAGRVFALDVSDGGLVERLGYAGTGAPISACALDQTTGLANVADILVVP